MSFRETLTRHSKATVTVALVVLLLSAAMLSRRLTGIGDRSAPGIYYLDLVEDRLFIADKQLPPITTESGNEAVRAHVFACGQCDDESTLSIQFLERFTEDAKAQFTFSDRDQDVTVMSKGHQISRYRPNETPDWIAYDSEEGLEIRQAALQLCDNAAECRP